MENDKERKVGIRPRKPGSLSKTSRRENWLRTLEDQRNALRAVKRCRDLGRHGWPLVVVKYEGTPGNSLEQGSSLRQSLSASVSGRAPLVAVMETGDLLNRHDSSEFGRLHCTRLRRVFR